MVPEQYMEPGPTSVTFMVPPTSSMTSEGLALMKMNAHLPEEEPSHWTVSVRAATFGVSVKLRYLTGFFLWQPARLNNSDTATMAIKGFFMR